MTKTTEKETKKPVFRTNIGAVSASVFLNTSKDGEEFPSALITRSYKTDDGYNNTSSYGANHLDELVIVVGRVKDWFKQNYPNAGVKA